MNFKIVLKTIFFFFFTFFFFEQKNVQALDNSNKKKFLSSKKKKFLKTPDLSHVDYCKKQLAKVYKRPDRDSISKLCEKTQIFPGCYSQRGKPLFHYEKNNSSFSINSSKKIKKQTPINQKSKRILTLALIHGDEEPSLRLAHSWMKRLDLIHPRNIWRVIPLVNPDGWLLKTRTNANGVDLNRNFPTMDWENMALHSWKIKKKGDVRRYPGPFSASEPETLCIINHIQNFQPDFIISIHSPYGVLDFDGPKKINFPYFQPLPWISLGHFPGSLGRYMWKDNHVPVLTIELKEKEGFKKLEAFDRLQDISGTVAIQASQFLKDVKLNKNLLKDKKKILVLKELCIKKASSSNSTHKDAQCSHL